MPSICISCEMPYPKTGKSTRKLCCYCLSIYNQMYYNTHKVRLKNKRNNNNVDPNMN